jgi:hypothetical protein
VGRSDCPKVTLIESRHLGLPEPLGERDDPGIDDAETEIGVASLELAAALEISPRGRLDSIDPSEDVRELYGCTLPRPSRPRLRVALPSDPCR